MNALIKNSFMTFAARCITLLSGFILSIFSAHFLGPQGRGNYYFVTSLSVLMVQLGSLGMQSSNVFLVAKTKNALANLTTNAVWISLIIGISMAVIFQLFSKDSQTIPGLSFLIILTPASLFYLLGTNLLVGINKIKIFNLFQIGSNLSLGLILLFCGIYGYSSPGFITATALSWLFFSLILLMVISRIEPLNYRFNFSLFKQGFGFGIKTYICCLFASVILKSNVFMLKYFMSAEVVGYYSIAAQMNEILALLPSTFSLILFPDLVKNPTLAWEKTRRVLFMVISCLLVIDSLIVWCAPWGLPLIYGVKFKASVPILLCLLPGSLCLGATSVMSQYLAANGYPKALIGIWIFAGFFSVLLSLLLIPQFSAIGAALSLSATYLLLAVMVAILVYRYQRGIGGLMAPVTS